MEIAILIIAVVVVIAVYWFVIRKPAAEEALPEAPEPKRLVDKVEAKKPKAQDTKPSASEKKKEPDPKKSEPKKEPGKQIKKEPEPKTVDADAKDVPEEADVPVDDAPKAGESTEPQAADSQPEPEQASEKEPAPLVGKAVDASASVRSRDVAGLRKGLGKSRAKEGFFGRLAKLIIGEKEIDPDIVDEMEEVLITSDVGVKTTEVILGRIREGLKSKELSDADKVWGALRQEAVRILSVGPGGLSIRTKPTVVLMVGVNGSGKTTTIGKIATQLKGDGKEVVLAAGDTFRAAAVQQLQVWGRRVGCDVVKGKDGADPGAVIFDSIRQGAESGADVVLADTAGRLHTKTNLMEELKKVVRTMGKAMEGAPHEILLVIDATNGQNALAQSRQFAEALPLTGIVLTKLDGTAKGGVILGICDELGVPVRYIGLGEKADDLRPFDAEEFVEALLGSSDFEENEAA
jgi:fused signal recognition particle receptor